MVFSEIWKDSRRRLHIFILIVITIKSMTSIILFFFQNTRVLSDFKARHVLNLEVVAQRKTSKPPCQPELPKLDISQQTRNLSNEQSVQSAPPTMPPGHTFKFVFIPYYQT